MMYAYIIVINISIKRTLYTTQNKEKEEAKKINK